MDSSHRTPALDSDCIPSRVPAVREMKGTDGGGCLLGQTGSLGRQGTDSETGLQVTCTGLHFGLHLGLSSQGCCIIAARTLEWQRITKIHCLTAVEAESQRARTGPTLSETC